MFYCVLNLFICCTLYIYVLLTIQCSHWPWLGWTLCLIKLFTIQYKVKKLSYLYWCTYGIHRSVISLHENHESGTRYSEYGIQIWITFIPLTSTFVQGLELMLYKDHANVLINYDWVNFRKQGNVNEHIMKQKTLDLRTMQVKSGQHFNSWKRTIVIAQSHIK